MDDTYEVQQLLENAGFREISVKSEHKLLTLPAPKVFLWQYIQSTPLLNLVSKASEEARTSLEQEIVKRWQEFVENDGMKYRQRMITATARK